MYVPKQQIRMALKRHFRSGVLLACKLLLLCGCAGPASNNLIDSVPSAIGGLAADTPERPVTPPAYPAVHDMPPPRPNTTLSAEEQIQLENEMTAVKTRQELITGVHPVKRAAPPAAPPPRVVPAASSNDSIY